MGEGPKCLDIMGSLRLLLSDTDHDIDLSRYRGPSEGFTKWQRIVDPLYYQRPFEERAEIASKMDTYVHITQLSTGRKALSLGPLPPLPCPHADCWAEDLLHGIVEILGITMGSMYNNGEIEVREYFMSTASYTSYKDVGRPC